MCDEYRPSLYKFKPDGTLVNRYVPKGTSMLGTTAQPVGTYGEESLPAVYAKRRANRGFEAIAYDKESHVIYAFIQSPLYNPSNITKDNSDIIRILGIDATTGEPVSEYVYVLEQNKFGGYATSRVDKIGDAVYKGNGKFLVIERDSEDPEVSEGKKYIFEIDINYAINLLAEAVDLEKELEEMTADELLEKGIIAVNKVKVTNLPSIGYQSSDKPEGLAWLPNDQIAVLNDNDFGLAGAGVTDDSVLGIISFADDYGFDASDKDGIIRITAHSTLGMYMPDAIASYEVEGATYILTVNEGDARDYDGYSEEVRVKDLILNPLYYPDAADLQTDENLGRLKTTVANGDYNNDGITEQIYSYGGRSFSIFDAFGNLVFDSADIFGRTTAAEEPNLFNEDDGEFDGRSDDKGVEPEAIAVGVIGDRVYAFVGLERQSSILVFDITNPREVEFITYYKGNRQTGDIAPEIIQFIGADVSPNKKNLLLVGYEVSGTVGILQIENELLQISETVSNNNFKMYPVPVNQGKLNFNKKISAEIFSVNGKLVDRFEDKDTLDVTNLEPGVYILKTKKQGSKRFLKW
ncbi:esterase-like activity of phytase family protein [Aquimarina sp. ERC-38]|uniref:choice-of-anchor I domain-containing protein n=1 Tax=Aquimarina sp. ERC-38 TaxID=2949996 RepID=UPI002245E092|nr:esterase-like activity of phytase family protein [Aquimarina sp. ERC-38]UZO79475.1 esterase-like activity of phytase family protein [Aquimarina sp. ERC-38]